MIPACDEDLLLLAQFLLDRFAGQIPSNKQLLNAIADWRRSVQ